MTEALFEDGAPHRKPLDIAGLYSHLGICICIYIDFLVFLLVTIQKCTSVSVLIRTMHYGRKGGLI